MRPTHNPVKSTSIVHADSCAIVVVMSRAFWSEILSPVEQSWHRFTTFFLPVPSYLWFPNPRRRLLLKQWSSSSTVHKISQDLDSMSNNKGFVWLSVSTFVLTQRRGRKLGFENKRIGNKKEKGDGIRWSWWGTIVVGWLFVTLDQIRSTLRFEFLFILTSSISFRSLFLCIIILLWPMFYGWFLFYS